MDRDWFGNTTESVMGVMRCDRRDCEHIMRDRVILDGTEYICGDCWDELCEAKWPDTMTAREVRDAIETFMDTRPGTTTVLDREGIEEEFKRLTGA